MPKLTRREMEVAELVAQGMTNREIAARLFISERTAESHVEQIRGKLGFHTRSQIAAWVATNKIDSQAIAASAVPTTHPIGKSRVPPITMRSRRGVLTIAAGTTATLAVLLAIAIAAGLLTPAASAPPAVITTVAASLSRPLAVAVGHDGEIYIAEGNRVRELRRDGSLITLAGTGVAGYSGDRGTAAEAQLNTPQGLAVDSSGDVFIADSLNNRIRRVARDGTITTVAGTGTAGFSGDGGPAVEAELYLPVGVAIGFGDAILIADTGNNRIRRVGLDGVIHTIAGSEQAGYLVDGGQAFFAVLNTPTGLAFDGEGNLYIQDTLNERVRKIDVSNDIWTVAGDGKAGSGGDGGPARLASLNLASNTFSGSGQGLSVDHEGNLYIADAQNHEVRRVDLHGKITKVVGTGLSGGAGDGGVATNAQLSSPVGVAVNATGALYIADAEDNRVRRVA